MSAWSIDGKVIWHLNTNYFVNTFIFLSVIVAQIHVLTVAWAF